ncbi:hypothetical protein F3K20_15075 [Streptomyces scabiei]|nr:hypothetical protein [Streptomyces sp. LBUM 1484]MBP5875761.1 hypothetical protein [Streptomyces sp. LBUM 1477]MBP5883479.1 hypothetical protein [Streptomyces sp. LBUM 1487]MBP5899510.1 hypothetical protein [Streptomyces sp. LBUM 1488]QTU46016.1 hypothetical protein F3K20_15075 [Streptomyces sp. LBUM 1482]QTU62002.1 hypothetical protein F3K22_14030 [Streptomyces sp. LBUM 1475]
MSEALRRIADALADVTEEEAAAVLRGLGARGGRQQASRDVPRTPLPPPGGSARVRSEVEWV